MELAAAVSLANGEKDEHASGKHCPATAAAFRWQSQPAIGHACWACRGWQQAAESSSELQSHLRILTPYGPETQSDPRCMAIVHGQDICHITHQGTRVPLLINSILCCRWSQQPRITTSRCRIQATLQPVQPGLCATCFSWQLPGVHSVLPMHGLNLALGSSQ